MSHIWAPQPGPQLAAIEAKWINELFYGGARGGGKSDYLLGDYLQDVFKYKEKWRGLLVRQSYPELEELIARSHDLYPPTGAVWGEQKKTWTWPNGAFMRMRSIENARDAKKLQGHQYCVAVGTPILMADGSAKAIEEIVAGEYVQTLEGAKPVIASIAPYEAECVRVSNAKGEQINPFWHPILTVEGWQSYASLLDNDSTKSEEGFQECGKHPSLSVSARLLERDQQLGIADIRAAKKSCDAYSSCGLFDESISIVERLLSNLFWDCLHIYKQAAQNHYHKSWPTLFGVSPYALAGSVPAQGSQCHYSAYCHLYDAQLPLGVRTYQEKSQGKGGAVAPSLFCYMMDALGNIPSNSHQIEEQHEYHHPYTGEVRRASEGSIYDSFEMAPCGVNLVADIQVKDANHYITANTGIVNKNSWIGWDELPQWPDDRAYRMLFACNRSAKGVPEKRIRASGNPGGVGHHWVKNRFIDANPLGFQIQKEQLRNGIWERLFIPAKVWDNKILLKNDPDYIQALEMVGSPELVRAWLEGDWNVITGAYFPEFSTDRHIIKPFEIPPHWFRVFSHDWGSASPFASIWGAVSDGDCNIPAGALVIYRELYGASGPNQGLKMQNKDIAAMTLSKEAKNEKISLRVADPACFHQDGGPSIAEDYRKEGLTVRAADNKRVPGWQQIRGRLIGQDDRPMIYFFDTCKDLIRTLPALQHDERKPEDVDTEGDDHLADALRYMAMSRPYMRPKPVEEKPRYLNKMTINELWANKGSRRKPGRI
jgi:hypothetical protein